MNVQPPLYLFPMQHGEEVFLCANHYKHLEKYQAIGAILPSLDLHSLLRHKDFPPVVLNIKSQITQLK